MAVSSTGGSSGSSAAAAAAAAAEARRRAAEEARRRAEAARQAREQAKRAAEAARKAAEAAQAKAAKAAEAAKKSKGPDKAEAAEAAQKAQKAAKAAQAAQAKADKALQESEERVARMAKVAEDTMRDSNAAAQKAGANAPTYSDQAISQSGAQVSEVRNAFEGAGRRREDVAQALGIRPSTDTNAIQRGLEAARQFDTLDNDPKTAAVLDDLDIRDGADLQAMGQRLAREMNGGAARSDDLPLHAVSDKASLAKVIASAGAAQTDAQTREALSNPGTATLIAHGADAAKAAEQTSNLAAAGYTAEKIADLAKTIDGDQAKFQAVIDNVSVLGDPDASTEDKLKAAVDLGDSTKKLLPPGALEGVLGRTLDGVKNVKDTIESIQTLTNPDASGVEKAQAGLTLANNVKDFAGDALPALADKLEGLDGPLKIAGAALTLVDPDASVKDKAIAGAELVSALPDLKGDLTKLKDVFTRAGVEGADQVVRAGNDLATLASRGMDPEAAAKLPAGQLQQMTELAAKTDGETFGAMVRNVTDPNQLQTLVTDLNKLPAEEASRAVSTISALDPSVVSRTLSDPQLGPQLLSVASKVEGDTAKFVGDALKGASSKDTAAFLRVASGMGNEALTTVLASSDDARSFASMVGKLDPANLEDFAKAAGSMDAGALRTIARFGGAAPASALNELAPVLAKVAGNDLVAKALGAFGKVLDVMNVSMTADIATKAIKGFTKMLPLVGAAAAVYDTGRFALEANEMRGKQNDLAMLASTGMKINAIDTVLNLIPGIGDVAGIATGLGALAVDIGYSAEKAKFEADPEGYQAPDWMKAVNIGAAVAAGPAGVAELVAVYGPKDAAELGLWAVGKGGELAKAAWDVIKDASGPLGEVALEAVETLKGLGEAGADALKYVATSPGRLGAAAAEAAVSGLKDLGEAGVEALQDVAAFGGDAAEFAVNGLKDLGEEGVEAAKAALGTLADLGGAVGSLAGDALGVLKKLNPLNLL